MLSALTSVETKRGGNKRESGTISDGFYASDPSLPLFPSLRQPPPKEPDPSVPTHLAPLAPSSAPPDAVQTRSRGQILKGADGSDRSKHQRISTLSSPPVRRTYRPPDMHQRSQRHRPSAHSPTNPRLSVEHSRPNPQRSRPLYEPARPSHLQLLAPLRGRKLRLRLRPKALDR